MTIFHNLVIAFIVFLLKVIVNKKLILKIWIDYANKNGHIVIKTCSMNARQLSKYENKIKS